MRPCERILTAILISLIFPGLNNTVFAQDPTDKIWIQVTDRETGYAVYSHIAVFKEGEKDIVKNTDGCGIAPIKVQCDSKLSLQATSKELSFFRSSNEGCLTWDEEKKKKISIKLKRLADGYTQDVHRSILDIKKNNQDRVIWYEYDWNAAQLIRKKGQKCTIGVVIKRYFMDTTESEWESESMQGLDEIVPAWVNDGRVNWETVIHCENLKNLNDIVTVRYEEFINKFKEKRNSDINTFVAEYGDGGTAFEPRSCADRVAELSDGSK